MKRICILLLGLMLAIGCTANPPAASQKAETSLPHKPPALTVRTGEAEGSAALGTYSWTWPNGDGTDTGVDADSRHSLDMLDYVTPLPLHGERTMALTFELGGLTLDQLTVRRWDVACAGDPSRYESDFETLPFTVNGDTVTADLVDGRGGIFEVHAFFTGECHGDGYYTFCLETQAQQND